MSNVIEFKKKDKKHENNFETNTYTVNKFLMTWEDTGLSYEGTVQTEWITGHSSSTIGTEYVESTVE